MKVSDLLSQRKAASAATDTAAKDLSEKADAFAAAQKAYNGANDVHSKSIDALHEVDTKFAKAIHGLGPVYDSSAVPPVVYESTDGATLNVVPVASLDSELPEDPPVNPPQPAPQPA